LKNEVQYATSSHAQGFSSCIHWVRATRRAWSTWLPYSGHHVASNLCYHCEGRSRIAPRLAYLAENADACALDASSCVLLKFFGSARVSPHHGRAVACNLWGVQRLKVHARCIRGSLFSFRILLLFSLALAPSRSARDRLRSWMIRKTSGTSTAIIVVIRPECTGNELFPSKDGCIVAQPYYRGFSPGK